jgi:FMN-dependent NADH-azoreductase
MATVLHIQASPRGEESFSYRTAQAFLESYRKSHPGDRVRTLDLFAGTVPEFGLAVARGKYRILHGQEQTPAEKQAWKVVEATIADFKQADKYLISSPMWNFSIPYVLKQYIDVIVQPGYTFTYTAEEGYKGLVTGRPARLILARGSDYLAGTEAAALDYQRPYLEFILRFVGFTDIRTILIGPTLAGGPTVADEKLAEAIRAAQAEAQRF